LEAEPEAKGRAKADEVKVAAEGAKKSCKIEMITIVNWVSLCSRVFHCLAPIASGQSAGDEIVFKETVMSKANAGYV
jgi:hypothetical protein